jgi:hypothetical protein
VTTSAPGLRGTEDRLRAALRAQAQTIRPGQLRELRHPDRRPARTGRQRVRRLAPAAAAVAVAAVIGVLAGVRLAAGPRPAPAAAAGGRPPFYVALPPPGDQGRPAATIHASATGRVLGRAVVHGQVLGAVTAAADGRTYVLSAYRIKPDSAIRPNSVTSFYRLTLAADGRVASLRRLPVTVPAGSQGATVSSMALSGDARTLAISVAPGTGQGDDRLEVVSLRTGRSRAWTTPWTNEVGSLSWGSGTALGFLTRVPPQAGRELSYQLHVLDTARPAGALLPASTPVPVRGGPVESAILVNHGRDVAAWTRGPGSARRPGAAILSEFSARTGQPLRLLYAVPGNGQYPGAGQVWSADPSGAHLLVGITTPDAEGGQPVVFVKGHAVLGRLDRGQLTQLPVIDQREPPQPAAW